MRKRNSGFLLAFPALAGFLVFYFVPFLITVWYSVSFGIGRREFVGLDNFRDLYTNEMFLLAVKNTLRYMAVTVPTTLFGALLLSVTLQNTTKGVRFFQLSFLYPMILPIASVILGVQFLWGSSGIWNKVVELLGGEGKDWMNLSAAFWILCILYCWRFTGYYVLIYFARLQMIPKEYYEYAALFGAGKVQSFRYITLPILVLCQEKVQVKSELFLQHSLFIQPVFPSYSISAHTHSRIHLVIDIHNDCGFLPYYKMSLYIQILIYRHGHNFLF